MLQAADVYLLGPETYAIIPQVLMGIILQRYTNYRTQLTNEYQYRGNSLNTE